MSASSDTGFHIFMALLGCYFVGMLVWAIRGLAKQPKTKKARKPRGATKDNADYRLMWSSYRAARLNGASVTESIRYATDELIAFQQTGHVPHQPPPGAAVAIALPPEESRGHFATYAQAILINSVTAIGVFGLHWPVGTALALYWSETVLATLLMFVLLMLWRRGKSVETRGGSVGEMIGGSLIFSAAHVVFLVVVVGLLLPKYSAAERFDRSTFVAGLLWIAVVLFVDFVFHAATIRQASEIDLQRRAELHMQRVGILHLTIIFGMLAMAIGGTPRGLLAVFATLKLLVDLMRRVR